MGLEVVKVDDRVLGVLRTEPYGSCSVARLGKKTGLEGRAVSQAMQRLKHAGKARFSRVFRAWVVAKSKEGA